MYIFVFAYCLCSGNIYTADIPCYLTVISGCLRWFWYVAQVRVLHSMREICNDMHHAKMNAFTVWGERERGGQQSRHPVEGIDTKELWILMRRCHWWPQRPSSVLFRPRPETSSPQPEVAASAAPPCGICPHNTRGRWRAEVKGIGSGRNIDDVTRGSASPTGSRMGLLLPGCWECPQIKSRFPWRRTAALLKSGHVNVGWWKWKPNSPTAKRITLEWKDCWFYSILCMYKSLSHAI